MPYCILACLSLIYRKSMKGECSLIYQYVVIIKLYRCIISKWLKFVWSGNIHIRIIWLNFRSDCETHMIMSHDSLQEVQNKQNSRPFSFKYVSFSHITKIFWKSYISLHSSLKFGIMPQNGSFVSQKETVIKLVVSVLLTDIGKNNNTEIMIKTIRWTA